MENPQEVTPEEKEERSEDEPEEEIKPEETEELNKDTDENDETEKYIRSSRRRKD
ncbi:hypothetical protein ACP0HM_05065 [Escherichia coli]